jgi:release factor glutamine methyltransferase
MTIGEARHWGQKKLTSKKITSAALDSEVLLSFTLKRPKEFLFTYPEKILTSGQQKKYFNLVKRRGRSEPVAYLIGRKEFFGLNFFVDKRVLIPRPETELLVETAVNFLQPKKSATPVIAEVGTGSGCIIISLLKSLPPTAQKNIIAHATDISSSALQIAKKNAREHGVKINFHLGHLLKPLAAKKINLLIANLPYGWRDWKSKTTSNNGLKFEPPVALFTKEGGLYLYRQFFIQLARQKYQPDLILCEFDWRQKNQLLKLVKKYLSSYQAKIKKDLAGLNRILILKNNLTGR